MNKNIFLYRSTKSAAFCAIQCLSFSFNPLSFYATKIIKPFLNSRISANRDNYNMGSNTEKNTWMNLQNSWKIKAKRLRATTFAIAKLEER